MALTRLECPSRSCCDKLLQRALGFDGHELGVVQVPEFVPADYDGVGDDDDDVSVCILTLVRFRACVIKQRPDQLGAGLYKIVIHNLTSSARHLNMTR